MKLKASTIVEVLVAITIVSICFTAFYVCFSVVNKSDKAAKMLRALELVEELKSASVNNNDLKEQEIEIGELHVNKIVKDTDNPKLKLLRFEVKEDSVSIEKMNYFIVVK